MKNRRNYYRILQVQPDAPSEIIQASYRAMMRDLRRHPDLGGSTREAALLNEAYETLMDPERRTAYDNKLFLRYTKQAVSENRKPTVVPVFCPVCRRPLVRDPAPGECCLTCRTPMQSADAARPGEKNSRAVDRAAGQGEIEYFSSWPGAAKQGKMIDLSPNGMRFACKEKLKPKMVLKISGRRLEASGAVTNVREAVCGGEKCYEIGVCFIAVNFKESRGTFLSTSA
ncbi:MAG TPA: J domain-containing protein [Acidobacteriota bacterium]|nr:J domain-containing protein [Acidobacteriota bacterium]